MSKFSKNNQPLLVSFTQIHAQNITPKLQEIDLFLKTNEAPYDASEVAYILGCPYGELMGIMQELQITDIGKVDFFHIVSHSTSYICRLINKQWKYIGIKNYTPEIIADIYELNPLKVIAAFNDLEVEHIDDTQLKEVFSRIHTPVFSF